MNEVILVDEMINEKSNKKKLLVPIIALMLCAVAVIGAGYAYQSSVTVEDNSVSGGSLTIDVKSDTTFLKDGTKDVIVTQDKVVSADSTSTITKLKLFIEGAGDSMADANGAPNTGTSTTQALSKLGTATFTIENSTDKDVKSAVVGVSFTNEVIGFGDSVVNFSTIAEFYVVYGNVATKVTDGKAEFNLDAQDVQDNEFSYDVYVLITKATVFDSTDGTSITGDTTVAGVVNQVENNIKISVSTSIVSA